MTEYNPSEQQDWFREATRVLSETGEIPYELWDKMHDGLKRLLAAANVKIGQNPIQDIEIPAGSLIIHGSTMYVVAFVGRKAIMLIDPAHGTRYSDTVLVPDELTSGSHGLLLSTLLKTYPNFGRFEIQLRDPAERNKDMAGYLPASVRGNIVRGALIEIDPRYRFEILRGDVDNG